MTTDRRLAIAALAGAGLLWGTTVPLSKLALTWLPPGWLTAVRFSASAAILLAVAGRRDASRLRRACSPAVLTSGAVGYGGSVILQNAGVARTSVSQAALLIGAAPVLVAIIAALWHRSVARPLAWAGFAVSLAGVGVVAGGRAGGASPAGDGLVLASLLLSAAFTVAQARLLRGRDPVALTAVQFAGAALASLPFAMLTEHAPAAPASPAAVAATAALVAAGTLVPFTLFAYGQSRVSAEAAGAFLNLEPLVGTVAGVVIFGNPAGPRQVLGGAAILAGIALGSLPLLAARQPGAPGRPHRGRRPRGSLAARARQLAAQPQPQPPPQQPPPRGAACCEPARPPTATADSSLTVSSWPCGQVAGADASVIGRVCSKVSPQDRQRNSYRGTPPWYAVRAARVRRAAAGAAGDGRPGSRRPGGAAPGRGGPPRHGHHSASAGGRRTPAGAGPPRRAPPPATGRLAGWRPACGLAAGATPARPSCAAGGA